MNILKCLKKNLLPIAAFLGGLVLTACADQIEVGTKIDESPYEKITRIDGMLLDQTTNKNQTVIEFRFEKHETSVYFALTRTPEKGVDVEVKIDPAYLEVYNKEHDTEFPLFPADLIALERNGMLLLAPDETRSAGVGITLIDDDRLMADKTYAVPLTATSRTEGITLTESASHAVYLVKILRGGSGVGVEGGNNCFKGSDAVKTVVFFEVNDTNPLNALEFVLKDSGKLMIDEVVIFAANTRCDPITGRVYLHKNPNVQFLLDNGEQYIQPLRKRGMKVLLGILGDHDQAGIAQLSALGARIFATELALHCKAYNLDGVSFDDEYSEEPDLGNPMLAPVSQTAAARLLYETKKAMPDKTVMVYYLGQINSTLPSVDGVLPGQFVDYAVDDYGGASGPMDGMTLKNCSGMSIELARGAGDSKETTAKKAKEEGYGYYMLFSLNPAQYYNHGGLPPHVSIMRQVCRGLYDQELIQPTHYYKKNETKRSQIE